MPGEVRGQRLYVNVSAAEARRRLKGRGLGVRKIHSGGRNRAVVIHSAEGRHLEQLQAVFADAGWSTSESQLGEPIQNLPNLGPSAAALLREAGVRSVDDLRRAGPAAAYAAVRRRHPEVRLNLLWALAAGLEGRDWRELTDEEQARLKSQV